MVSKWSESFKLRAAESCCLPLDDPNRIRNVPMHQLSRRRFLSGTTIALAAAIPVKAWSRPARQQTASVGLITDVHFADKPPAGTRHYRQSLSKLKAAAGEFQKQPPDVMVELGDLIDAADSVKVELGYLRTINDEFRKLCPHRRYVLGNHCVDTLTKQEFLNAVQQERSYDSFDCNGVHFVILDSCFRSDGQPYQRKNFHWTDANVPDHELEWLRKDLAATKLPTVVFAHQRLDVEGHHGVKNQADVRAILEASEKVVAVFQGHSHSNDLKSVNGIHYCTLVAMVEGSELTSNGYSRLNVTNDGSVQLFGFARQSSFHWPK